jgi:hypothetical protein
MPSDGSAEGGLGKDRVAETVPIVRLLSGESAVNFNVRRIGLYMDNGDGAALDHGGGRNRLTYSVYLAIFNMTSNVPFTFTPADNPRSFR